MREDTLQIIEEYSIKTAGNKKNIEKAEVLVSPDEKIFFIAPTNMIITTNNTRKKEKLPGVIILTAVSYTHLNRQTHSHGYFGRI